jgi:hypothetical protein
VSGFRAQQGVAWIWRSRFGSASSFPLGAWERFLAFLNVCWRVLGLPGVPLGFHRVP